MKVKEIMKTDVFTVKRHQSIRECGAFLEQHDINGAPVMDGSRLVGMITRTDVFRSILPSMPEVVCEEERYFKDPECVEERIERAAAMPVSEIMGAPVISVDENTPIIKAGSKMILRRVKQLPVMRAEALVGIITLTDICRSLMARAGAQRETAHA